MPTSQREIGLLRPITILQMSLIVDLIDILGPQSRLGRASGCAAGNLTVRTFG
jgi:hypothetical protein